MLWEGFFQALAMLANVGLPSIPCMRLNAYCLTLPVMHVSFHQTTSPKQVNVAVPLAPVAWILIVNPNCRGLASPLQLSGNCQTTVQTQG